MTEEKEAAGKEAGSEEATLGKEEPGGKKEEETVQTVEEIARDLGWRPPEEFQGDPEDCVDAATFLRKGVVVQKKLQRHIKDLERSVVDLKEHNERVYKTQVSQLQSEIKTLKEERKAAIAEGNVALVEQLDEKIETATAAVPSKPSEKQVPADVDEKFNAWVSQNKWYTQNPEMKQYADKVGEKYAGAPIEKILQKVDEAVKELWPEQFQTKTKPAADAVEGAVRRTSQGGKKSFNWSSLTDEQRRTGDRFVRQGIMTREDYVKDLADMGELQ